MVEEEDDDVDVEERLPMVVVEANDREVVVITVRVGEGLKVGGGEEGGNSVEEDARRYSSISISISSSSFRFPPLCSIVISWSSSSSRWANRRTGTFRANFRMPGGFSRTCGC